MAWLTRRLGRRFGYTAQREMEFFCRRYGANGLTAAIEWNFTPEGWLSSHPLAKRAIGSFSTERLANYFAYDHLRPGMSDLLRLVSARGHDSEKFLTLLREEVSKKNSDSW